MKISLLSICLLIFTNSCTFETASNINEIDSPAGPNSSTPFLYTDDTGTLFMSWIEENQKMATLKYSSFSNGSWSSPAEISSDSTWFLNWADYPSIIANKGKPMAAHWLNKKPGGTYSYDVNIATYSEDWTDGFPPHSDQTPTEHGFVSMTPVSDSTFYIVWLDGRETNNRAHDEYSDIDKAMTLRGALIHKNGEVLERHLIDDSVCDCCNTSIAKTEDGLVVVYRNRTDEEIRDIYISTYKDGSWSEGKAIGNDNWNIAACPVNGPSIAIEDQRVAVSWFTAANDQPKVQLILAQTGNDNISSSTPILIDGGNPIGRVKTVINNDKVWVSWLTTDHDVVKLKISAYSFSGKLLNTYSVPDISPKRSSGFPQISHSGDDLFIAYTDISSNSNEIRLLKLSDSN